MGRALPPEDSEASPSGEATEEVRRLVGTVVADKYKVVSFLARGAMGVVYVAEQIPIGRKVALKVLFPNPIHLDAENRFEQRFLREGATCGKLRSPHTVTLYDYGQFEHAGRRLYYMAMEFIEGRTLAEVLEAGPIEVPRAVRILLDVTSALREAHKLGIVHRDLKPGNLMLFDGPDGEMVKVLDFGIAKLAASEDEIEQDILTVADGIMGSPRYMAPEQIRSRAVDVRADIYALGVILFEMLAGEPPYRGRKALDTMLLHLQQPIPTLAERAVGPLAVPRAVEDLVMRALAKDPADRFQDVDAFRAALRSAVDGASGTDENSSSTLRASLVDVERAQPAESPWRALRILVLALLLPFALLQAMRLLPTPGPEVVPPAPTPALAPAPAPAPPPAMHTIRLASTPPGARVVQDGKAIGTTPLDVMVPAGATRSWELSLDGFQPASLTATDVSGDGALEAVLEKVPVAPAPRPAPAPKPSDIKVKR